MTQLATLETRLREAGFVIEQDPTEPETRRILADRQGKLGEISAFEFALYLSPGVHCWTLTQVNRCWFRLQDLEDAFDLVIYLLTLQRRESARLERTP
jgi:hypothetical protein